MLMEASQGEWNTLLGVLQSCPTQRGGGGGQEEWPANAADPEI